MQFVHEKRFAPHFYSNQTMTMSMMLMVNSFLIRIMMLTNDYDMLLYDGDDDSDHCNKAEEEDCDDDK